MEARSRRPALLDAHDADLVSCETGGLSRLLLRSRENKTRRNEKIHPKNSGTATVYLLPTYLPPTGVDIGIH